MITIIWLHRHPAIQTLVLKGKHIIPLETCQHPGEQNTTFVTTAETRLGVTISSFRQC